MNLLYFLADTFINTFGITKPSDKARKHAALFIVVLMILVIVCVTIAGYSIHTWIR